MAAATRTGQSLPANSAMATSGRQRSATLPGCLASAAGSAGFGRSSRGSAQAASLRCSSISFGAVPSSSCSGIASAGATCISQVIARLCCVGGNVSRPAETMAPQTGNSFACQPFPSGVGTERRTKAVRRRLLALRMASRSLFLSDRTLSISSIPSVGLMAPMLRRIAEAEVEAAINARIDSV
jgi:hypothetical protein